ncbi:efflux RND transporter periplasmic adaptor subunit [Salisaeta longa]|uniref:efflux RND transporter periplasmic adaptor subunit n=1 Tax=Salisaeta longa TaxID=503170 RepID=UPI0003B596F2|nr:efflux RND transporter periplasmic adaptor subunit [Salisaeta longa]
MPTVFRYSRPVLVALTLGLMTTLTACSTDTAIPDSSADAPIPVDVIAATATAQQQMLRYTGTIQGAQRVPLSTKLMGIVTELNVETGDRVRKGQTLVRVRSENLEAQKRQVNARLQGARAALQNAKINFERIQRLYKQKSATKKAFDDAQTAYERARAQVEALNGQLAEINEMLAYATVDAPITGYVVDKRTEEGALAVPGQPLLVVETLDALKAVVQVPEADINRFATGDSVTVEVGAAGNVARRGVVTQIDPAGNYASRQFKVQVRLLRQNMGALKSGMYAQVLHPSGVEQTLTVPEEALVTRGQLTGLFVVKDSTALLRWIRTGEQRGNRIEVLSGLRQGERYITSISGRMRDGQPVRPR